MLAHLYQLTQQRAARFPRATALGAQDGLLWRILTSEEVQALTDRLAAELADESIRSGDRVVLWLPSHWRIPIYLFALWKLGAIAVPFDREMNPEAGARILDSVAPRRVLSGYAERPAWAHGATIVPWWEPGSRVATAPAGDWTPPGEDLAAVVFTSGTTGTPKGCMITHANLCSQVEALHATIALDTSCRLASVLPLSHLFELTVGLLYPFANGAAIHYVPSRRGPDVLRVLNEQRITHMVAVPQLLTVMGQALEARLAQALPAPVRHALNAVAARLPFPARRRLFWLVHGQLGGHLHTLVSGGAALPLDTQRLWERLGVRVVQGYGVSECSPVIAGGVADGSTPVGSVGKPLPGVEVRLGAEGELLLRGPNVMRGYWNDPAGTAAVLRDGWLATGDLVRRDGAGNLWVTGRARDLIKLPSGMNVWPEDVEAVLCAQPGVKDAAVVAVPTSAGGATLHAYLLPVGAAPDDAALAAIVAAANGRLAQHQRIATASWWPEVDFPRTSMLKLRRHLLPPPESVRTVKVESVQAADDPVGQAIAGLAGLPGVGVQQTLASLGLDSLGLVELALALEAKTGKAVADGDLLLEMTVEQVRAFIASAPAGEDARPYAPRGLEAFITAPPAWVYSWGQVFRVLSFPIDCLYRVAVTRTVILGGEHLAALPARMIFAGTHRSSPDMPLVRFALRQTPARGLVRRLIVAISADGFAQNGPLAAYGILAFGLHPLRQSGEREASLRALARLASAGHPILIFPQGTLARSDQEIAGDPTVRFRPGVAHLAAALEAAVVPFGLAGCEALVPPHVPAGFKGSVIAGIPVTLHRGPLAIAFGAPFRLEPGETPLAFAARLQSASYALTRQAEQALQKLPHPPAASTVR